MSKHATSGHTPTALPRDDLEDNPSVGASRGTTIAGEDPHILTGEGRNTEEGDVGNDAAGAPTPIERHRTNR